MRICLVLEGCYPYVHGGVSTWMHGYIQAMPEHEFVLWVIGAHAADRGKFVYELPGNVAGVAVLAIDAGGRLLAMGPHGHALGSRSGKAGDGGSPGAGANQRNIHDSLLLIVGLGDALGKRELGLLTRHELFDVRAMGPHHGDAD